MLTLIVLLVVLLALALTVWVGIYESKKRVKTAMPDKDTEIDKKARKSS